MFVRKKIDYYPITVILLVFGIDLMVLLFSPSLLITITWAICSLYIKGFICCWNHHHQHCNFFTISWANRLLELIMGLHTGIVGEAWVLHHTLGHHINYLDQSKDESAWKTTSGKLMSHMEYTLKVSSMGYLIAFKVGKRHPKSRNQLIQNILLTVLVLGLFSWINWIGTIIIFIIPMIVLLFFTTYDTYHHHAGLDLEDPYKATYNITNHWYNFFTCNLGYHTAHHLQCGRHWSELPQLHEEIKEKIPSHLYREPGFPFSLMMKIEHKFSGGSPKKERMNAQVKKHCNDE
ncbi:MAG: fatty acid desaturase [Xenococcus sp. MO_188.B8]|nr:fatty acid desaturase [Xenococcus sp. MO_188.B8]